MAGHQDPRGARMLTQKEHLKDWLRPNPNKKVFNPARWEKECNRLRARGIQEEELTIYTRTINSADGMVNDLNDEIVNALNQIGACRRELFWMYKSRENQKSLNKKLGSIVDLKMLIHERQQQIAARGGNSERIPGLFDHAVRI